MAMKENFISMAPDEESNAKVSPIDNNKTLMIDQYTSDAEPGNPEFVESIQNINDAFAHFKPKVEVDFVDEEGGSVNEVLEFNELRDFEAQGGKGNLVKNSQFLSGVKQKIDTSAKIRKSIEQNRKLRDILKDASAKEELKEMFDHFPEDCLWTIKLNDFFLSSIYVTNMDELKSLRCAQMDKSYYIPTVAEVDEFYETGALLSDKAYQDMFRFLEKEMGLHHVEAEDILFDLWDKVSGDDDPHGTLQWFWNQLDFESEKQMEKIANLYMPLSNGTRMRVNRGHKPIELHEMASFGPGNMPVITAGSSHAAEMLTQIAPEIQQMEFGLDLESNAGRVPVMEFPNGMDGAMKMSEKKIYPNDPCPCGSGKKYKKCCGRN